MKGGLNAFDKDTQCFRYEILSWIDPCTEEVKLSAAFNKGALSITQGHLKIHLPFQIIGRAAQITSFHLLYSPLERHSGEIKSTFLKILGVLRQVLPG